MYTGYGYASGYGGYPQSQSYGGGYATGGGYSGGSNSFAFILVLFILLVIIGCSCFDQGRK